MSTIKLFAGAKYFEADQAERVEAMVRALVPEGCQITKEHSRAFAGPDPRDPLADRKARPSGAFAIEWSVQP